MKKKIDPLLLKMLVTITVSVLIIIAVFNFGDIFALISSFFRAISPIISGACIAFILNVPMRGFENKILAKHKEKLGKAFRPVCLALTLSTVAGIISVFVLLIAPEVKDTVVKIATNLPYYAQTVAEKLSEITGKTVSELLNSLDINWTTVSLKLVDIIENSGNELVSGTLGVTGSVLEILMNLLTSFVFAMWILLKKERIGSFLSKLLSSVASPSTAGKVNSVLILSSDIFSSFVSGQLLEALILGSLGFIGMLILRIPYATTAAAIITVTALIPIFGAFLGIALSSLLILTESAISVLWFLIFILILQVFETNVIYPKMMGRSVGLPGIWVLIAVTVGGDLFGAIGLLTAVPACAVLYCLANNALDKRLQAKRNSAEAPAEENSEAPRNTEAPGEAATVNEATEKTPHKKPKGKKAAKHTKIKRAKKQK